MTMINLVDSSSYIDPICPNDRHPNSQLFLPMAGRSGARTVRSQRSVEAFDRPRRRGILRRVWDVL